MMGLRDRKPVGGKVFDSSPMYGRAEAGPNRLDCRNQISAGGPNFHDHPLVRAQLEAAV
jgi:hypothetical protein